MAPQAFRLDTPLSAQIPAFREISAPRAPCFEMNAFCVSAQSDAFMQFHTFPSQRNLAENSTLKRSGIQGEEQSSRSDRGFPPPRRDSTRFNGLFPIESRENGCLSLAFWNN